MADTGEPLGSLRSGMYIRGQGGFGGPRAPADELPWTKPEREPDKLVPLVVPINQALIFRLNGDRNPAWHRSGRVPGPTASRSRSSSG